MSWVILSPRVVSWMATSWKYGYRNEPLSESGMGQCSLALVPVARASRGPNVAFSHLEIPPPFSFFPVKVSLANLSVHFSAKHHQAAPSLGRQLVCVYNKSR